MAKECAHGKKAGMNPFKECKAKESEECEKKMPFQKSFEQSESKEAATMSALTQVGRAGVDKK